MNTAEEIMEILGMRPEDWPEEYQEVKAKVAEAEKAAIKKFCQMIADQVRLEYEAGGRYSGHLILPWEDVARPLIYSQLKEGQDNGE